MTKNEAENSGKGCLLRPSSCRGILDVGLSLVRVICSCLAVTFWILTRSVIASEKKVRGRKNPCENCHDLTKQSPA